MWRFGVAATLLVLLAVLVADLLFGEHVSPDIAGRYSRHAQTYGGSGQEPLLAARSTAMDGGNQGRLPPTGAVNDPDNWSTGVRDALSGDGEARMPRVPSTAEVQPFDTGAIARLPTAAGGAAAATAADLTMPRVGGGSGVRSEDVDTGRILTNSNRQAVTPETPRTESKRTVPTAIDAPSARDVAEAQRGLAILGYSPGPVDGRLGKRTAAAVLDFQRDANLPADGRIDKRMLARLSTDARARTQLRQQELEAMAPAPPMKQDGESKRGVFGSVLGGFQRLLGRDFNSVRRPDELAAYCRANVDTWIYDFGREAFVYCGNVVAGQIASQSTTVSAETAATR
jgi:Putative peptidoglycan binding domain